jgi:complex iron-sulfur molybdoenzyme family reductase subunit gamma
MKKLLLSSAVATIASSALWSANIVATKVEHSLKNIEEVSPLWKEAKVSEVSLYPQTTVKMFDKIANDKNAENGSKIAKVQAIYNDEEIAFLIRWKDDTLSIQKGYRSDSYGDGFAVQFAKDFSNTETLPYIGMGSEGREVVVHLQKAAPNTFEPNGNGNVELQVNRKNTDHFEENLAKFDQAVKDAGKVDYERTFVSAGFRSMTEIKDGSVNSNMNMVYNIKRNCWKGTLTRDLKDEYLNLDAPAIPVAFAVWDGEKNNRDGLKLLSGWTSVELEGKNGGEKLVSALNDEVAGDLANGKSQFEMNCAACHITKDMQMSMPFMAPDLSNIGGYASAGYIKESIVNPNAVVVPGYNRNAHPNFEWYNLVDGKRVSTMPGFDWLDEKSLTDIVAYVKTLKSEEEK